MGSTSSSPSSFSAEEVSFCRSSSTSMPWLPMVARRSSSSSGHWTQSRRSKAKLSKPTETSAVEPPPRKTLPYFKTLKMRLDSGEYDYRRSDVCSAERPKSKLPSREFSAKRLAEKCRHPLDASCYTNRRPNANHTQDSSRKNPECQARSGLRRLRMAEE